MILWNSNFSCRASRHKFFLFINHPTGEGQIESFDILKINIIARFWFGLLVSGRRCRCSVLLLIHLILHTAMHFPKSLFDFSRGHVHRNHQFKNELVYNNYQDSI